MKKTLIILLLFFASITTWAYDFKSGTLYYNITSNTAPYTVEVTYDSSNSGNNPTYINLTNVNIPQTVSYSGKQYAVTSIGDWTFSDCTSLTYINIPKSVTQIGTGAFSDCTSLISINIPNGIVSIGNGAFEGSKIYNTTSNWENGVLYVDNCLIQAETDISGHYVIKNSTRLIADYAFKYCTELTSITIPNSVTSIGDCAFAFCNSLRSVTLPSIKQLGHSAFFTCGLGKECINQLDTVICYATIPPIVYNSSVFSNYDATLYVPCKSISSYQSHEVWKQFSNIQCIGIDFLEIPYDATSFTEEERNSNPERIIYPATLEDKDSVDMICEQVGGDCMEAVDLGLSVKWATCNVGASNPEDYGGYFAWGETEPKTENEAYNWSTYKWCNGSSSTLTKYNNSSSYGTVDNKKTLELADDAARANWGGAWRMPTDAEMTELREQCTWTWTTLNGVNGYKVTGTNGNSIFLPAAGCRLSSSLGGAGSSGYYWSSSLSTGSPFCAWGLVFGLSSVGGYSNPRFYGYRVRPVCH